MHRLFIKLWLAALTLRGKFDTLMFHCSEIKKPNNSLSNKCAILKKLYEVIGVNPIPAVVFFT